MITQAKLISYGDSDIRITKKLTNSEGLIQSKKLTILRANTLKNNNGDINSQNLDINTQEIDLTNSNIYASNNLILTLPQLDNIIGSNIGSGNNLTINAINHITNRAELTANGNLKLDTNGTLINHNLISSGAGLNIDAKSLTNYKTISGGKTTTLTIANNIDNHSRISSKQNLNASAKNITNRGFFQCRG